MTVFSMAEDDEPKSLASAEDSTTFEKDISIQVQKPVGSMSISPCGRDVVLASRQGLHIIDLDSPYAPPRHLPHHTPWEVADVQWSPFAARDYWVVSTSNQKALVWNLAMTTSQASIEHVLHAHTRAITDINFSAHHPDILATCAVDSFVHCWDLRHPARPAMTFCDWFAGATQVKWNRQDSHILASSHDKFLQIWDDRKGAYPLHSIEAHDTKIYGVDWNRTRPSGVVTCSLDKSIKFWDYRTSSDEPERIIHTPFPVWRARHTPFGWGLLAMPQRGNNDLHLYDRRLNEDTVRDGLIPPVRSFEGHQGQVKEFLWRARGTIEDGIDERDFQLISWGADQKVRLHTVDKQTLKGIGYEKGMEVRRKYNLTRKNALYRSFREDPSKPTGNSRMGVSTAGFMTQNNINDLDMGGALNVGMSKAPIPSTGLGSTGGFMSSRTGTYSRVAARNDVDPIAWMKGVKIGKRETIPSDVDQSQASLLSPILHTDKGWDSFDSLGEEITYVGASFGKVKFEEVDVHHRLVTVSMSGPWGPDNVPIYIKSRIMFPNKYPDAKPPVLTLEKTASLSEDTVSKIAADVQIITNAYVSRQKSCLEAILRYLLGEQSLEEITAWVTTDKGISTLDLTDDGAASSSDEDDDGVGRFHRHQSNDMDMSGSGLLGANSANVNVPLPKACGAIWADNGLLICFFPPKEDKAQSLLDTLSIRSADWSSRNQSRVFEGFGRLHTGSPGLKTKASTLDSVEGPDSDSDSSFDSSTRSSGSSEIIRLPRRTFNPPLTWRGDIPEAHHGRSVDESQRSSGGLGAAKGPLKKPKNVISIHNYQHLFPSKRQLAQQYVLGGNLQTCAHNAKVAESQGEQELADTWTFVDLILGDKVPLEQSAHPHGGDPILITPYPGSMSLRRQDSAVDLSFDIMKDREATKLRGRVKWGKHPFGRRWFVDMLFRHFEQLADVQMLALLACVLSEQPVTRTSRQSCGLAKKPMRSRESSHFLPSSRAAASERFPSLKGSIDYYPSQEVAWSLHQPSLPKVYKLHGVQLTNTTPHSTGSSVGTSASDTNIPFSTGVTPPQSYRPSRMNLERSNSQTQSLSTSPEQYRLAHRSSSNLVTTFASVSFSRPFSFTASASSSPPTAYSKKRPSPVGSYAAGPAPPGVTWGGSGVFGRRLTITEDPKPVSVLPNSDDEEDMPGVKEASIGICLKNQNLFDLEGYASVPLLDPDNEWKYQAYRNAYANMLTVWEMPMASCEVLKYNQLSTSASESTHELDKGHGASPITLGKDIERVVGAPNEERLGLRLMRTCTNCGRVAQHGQPSYPGSKCGICVKKHGIMSCVLCTEIVIGLSSPCLACGHVVHSACRLQILASDLGADGECISGCGCVCADHAVVEVEVAPEPLSSVPSTRTLLGANEQEQHGWLDERDDDAWEDVAAYESLAKNLGGAGRGVKGRHLTAKASQIWRGKRGGGDG